MADPAASVVKRETNSEVLPKPLPPRSQIFSRLPPAVLDTIIGEAATLGDAKTNTRTLLACARTCRAMLSSSQKHLFKAVVLAHPNEQPLLFSRAIDSKPALGVLVKSIEIHYEGATSIYPLPPHVIGRMSNLQRASFAGLGKHGLLDTSFIRVFAAACYSLRILTVAFFGFPRFSDVVRVVWSFPNLETFVLQSCAWGESPADVLPDPALHPGHLSHLQRLTVHLNYASRVPLQLKPFGTRLTRLQVDASHSFARTLEYQDISALENLETLALRYTKDDISILPQVLSHVRSPKLRWLAIEHRVQDQTREATVRQLAALKPKLQDVFARPIFWDLEGVDWEVSCTVLPTAVEVERWRLAVIPFMQVLADRNILTVFVQECSKAA